MTNNSNRSNKKFLTPGDIMGEFLANHMTPGSSECHTEQSENTLAVPDCNGGNNLSRQQFNCYNNPPYVETMTTAAATREQKRQEDLAKTMEKAVYQEKVHEMIKNKRDTEYWDPVAGPDGTFAMVRRNTLVDPQREIVSNLKPCSLNPLVSTNREDGYYRLVVEVNGIRNDIFLKKSETGNPKYLLKKLNGIGAEIKTHNDKLRNECVILLMSKLMAQLGPDEEIASNIGWVRSRDTYRFVEKGALLWADVEKNSK